VRRFALVFFVTALSISASGVIELTDASEGGAYGSSEGEGGGQEQKSDEGDSPQ